MIDGQNAKYVVALAPISVAGGAGATTVEVDTLGFDFAEFIIQSGLIPSTGVATLKIQESDASGSGQADITGAAFTALVDADDGKIICCFMSLKARKRYLTLVITNGATNASLLASIVRLSRAEQIPATATARGLKAQLNAGSCPTLPATH
jgi:hypothetical protein